MRWLISLAVSSIASPLFGQVPVAVKYPQLISTRHADRSRLPVDFARPVPKFDFDDGAAWSLAYWLGVYHGYVK
jgi:hypothetical protein